LSIAVSIARAAAAREAPINRPFDDGCDGLTRLSDRK
jgi:hypothetical protein